MEQVVIGDAVLYHADCMDILPTLSKVDAVITDPPYGINQANGFGGFGGFGKPIKRREYIGDWDDSRPEKHIIKRIVEAGNIAIIWGGQYFADLLEPRGKWLWWDKCQTMPSFGDGELAWTNLAGVSPKKFVYSNNGLLAKEKNRVHPTQKPIAVMKWCIEQTKDCKTILDPFMGSGTTGVAAIQMGRQFIGIEKDRRYFDIACERIQAAQKQPDLFIESAPDQMTIL